MNGELVPWDDAKVHVLSHGLHYGTGVFEGIRAYETERGTAVFRHREHLERLASRPSSTTWAAVLASSELREATHELIRAQRACELLHPADRLPRLRRDGTVRAERADRRRRRRLAVGRLPRRGGQAQRHPAPRSPRGGGISRDSLIPHAKASGQYLNSILAKTESANAGYDEAILLDDQRHRLRGLRREHLHRPRRRARRRRGHTASILDGITRKSVIQIAERPGLRGRGARHRAGRALPRRGGVPHRHCGRARAGARGRRPPARRAGRDDPGHPGEVRGRAARARPASTSSGWTWSSNRVKSRRDASHRWWHRAN